MRISLDREMVARFFRSLQRARRAPLGRSRKTGASRVPHGRRKTFPTPRKSVSRLAQTRLTVFPGARTGEKKTATAPPVSRMHPKGLHFVTCMVFGFLGGREAGEKRLEYLLAPGKEAGEKNARLFLGRERRCASCRSHHLARLTGRIIFWLV
jgi:hypothetical protein